MTDQAGRAVFDRRWRSLPIFSEVGMYYVIQTAPGGEAKAKQMIERLINKELFDQCFFLTRDTKKKYHGEWKTVTEKLLPGYVFIRTDAVEVLYRATRRVPALIKFLGKDEDSIVPISPEETAWVERLVKHGAHIPASKIDISEGDKVTILTDPLKDLEGYIKKLNLHKRVAEVEVAFMGRKTVLYLGIEMVEKTDSNVGC